MSVWKLSEVMCHSLPALTDLSAALNLFAKINTDGTVSVQTSSTAATVGNFYEVGAAGVGCSFQWGGIGKVIAGATIAIGDRIASDANGKAKVAAVGDYECGTAISGGAAGTVISFIWSTGRRHA